jgi:hypothetical protein
MSDMSHEPGWWQAPDGQWHAPLESSTEEVTLVSPKRWQSALVRKRWTIAAPIIAACMVVAIVLNLSGGGSSTPGGSNLGFFDPLESGLTGEFVSTTASSQAPIYMQLTQSGESLSGTITTSYVATTSKPLKLIQSTGTLSGQAEGSVLLFVVHQGSMQGEWSGTITGKDFQVNLGSDEVSFVRGSLAVYQALLSKAGPMMLLSVMDADKAAAEAAAAARAKAAAARAKAAAAATAAADNASVKAAQTSLANALISMNDLYQANHSFADKGHPYNSTSIDKWAPDFNWTTSACFAQTSKCVSFEIMDVSKKKDNRGVALSTFSAATATCWYAVDLESTPELLKGDSAAFDQASGGADSSVKTAGVYYARSPSGQKETACMGLFAVDAQHVTWGPSFQKAGNLS